jgi:hypothetical protein
MHSRHEELNPGKRDELARRQKTFLDEEEAKRLKRRGAVKPGFFAGEPVRRGKLIGDPSGRSRRLFGERSRQRRLFT